MSNHEFQLEKKADTYYTMSLETGISPKSHTPMERSVSEKGKVELWFVDPLKKFGPDDGFVCLLVCFPLIETVVRYELNVPEDGEFTFSHGSAALKWFATFMTIPEAKAQEVWDALRNGLMHRAMIKSSTSYVLKGEMPERPAQFKDDVLYIYVWVLRDRVVDLLMKHHKRLWNDKSCPLPRISVVN